MIYLLTQVPTPDTATLLSQLGVPALVAAVITGVFGYFIKKADFKRPDVISSSYAQLVDDLRHELVVVREEVKYLKEKTVDIEADGRIEHMKVKTLERQVEWLLQRLPKEYRDEYFSMFGHGPE